MSNKIHRYEIEVEDPGDTSHGAGPSFEHDCPDCDYLGKTIAHSYIADLYLCGRGSQAVIARYSSKPEDYSSTHIEYARPEGHAELFCAAALAKAKLDKGEPMESDKLTHDDLYPLGDIYHPAPPDLSYTARRKWRATLRARWDGQPPRCPRMGEWYLSGSIIHAYYAYDDISTAFYIAEIVQTKTIVQTTVKVFPLKGE